MTGAEWTIVIACAWLGFNFLFLALMLLRFFVINAREQRAYEADMEAAKEAA